MERSHKIANFHISQYTDEDGDTSILVQVEHWHKPNEYSLRHWAEMCERICDSFNHEKYWDRGENCNKQISVYLPKVKGDKPWGGCYLLYPIYNEIYLCSN